MKKQYLVTLGVLIVVASGYFGWQFFQVPLTPANLAVQALTASTAADRLQATTYLTMIKNSDAVPHLRRVATESKDADVLVLAINGLAPVARRDCLPLLFDDMNHEQSAVRRAAFEAVRDILGPSLPENIKFSADAPAPERQEATRQIRELYQKETADIKKDKAAQFGPGVASLPASPSEAPTPSSGIQAQAPMGSYENPALNLLSWMCRALAVLLLVAELVGAFALIVGELDSTRKSKAAAMAARKNQASVANEVERILAKNSTGMWSKVAMLLSGAVVMIALLTVAEMIQLAISLQQTAVAVQQTAVRVEQKIESLSRK